MEVYCVKEKKKTPNVAGTQQITLTKKRPPNA